MARYSAVLKGGAPWGFRLQGGRDTGTPVTIAKVNPNSKAARAYINIGDVVESINSTPAYHLDSKDAINLVHSTYGDLDLVLCRQSGLTNGTSNNMSTTSTTKTTIIKPDPSASTEEIEEPPPPRILESGQFLPPVSHQPKPSYSTNNNEESWPAPPQAVSQPVMQRQQAPIVHHPAPPPTDAQSSSNPHMWSPPSKGPAPARQEKPRFRPVAAPTKAKPAVWTPSSQSSHDLEPSQDGGSLKDVPPVWTPAGTSNKPKEYKPVRLDLNRQPRPSVEGASDSGSTRSNDDAATSPSYTWNPPPTRTSPGNGPSEPSEVYRPTNVTEQYRPPPTATEQYKSTNAPQQYAPVSLTDRPATESRPSNSQDQYPQPPDVPADLEGRPRTASDPVMHNSGGMEEKPGVKQVPNGHVVNLPRSVSPTVTLLQYQREQKRKAASLPRGMRLLSQPLQVEPYKPVPVDPRLIADDDLKYQIRNQLRHPSSDVSLDPSHLPEGAVYQTQTVDGDVVHTDTYYPVKQVMETKKERKIVEAPTYEGIGPRDSSGLPLGLRQHVKETNRHDWYKEMFKSIHKRDEEEDDFKVGSQPDGLSAREPKGEVDARWDPQRYQAQPRSIENYRPGASSLAAKDRTATSDMYNPPPEPITAAQFGRRNIEGPLKREIRRQVEAAPHRTADDSQIPRSPKEPPIGQSKPHAATLPRLPKPRSSESSGLSAAERLGIKSPPPQRNPPTTQNASQKERERMLSGGDRLYNYRNPPSTIDKATAEKLIQEERQKRKLVDRDNQQLRRHSDFTPVKSPIITNERFNDLLGEPPKVAEKPLPKWKQEEAAKKAEPTSPNLKPELKACVLALYPFKAQTAKELSFAKGDTIYLRRDIDKNWYEGEHHGSVGIFPKAYVEVVTSIEEARLAMLSSPSTEGKARAKYKFKGETQMELSFNKGDIIDLTRKIDSNWWDAKLGSKKGIVPASYVDVIREPSASPASKSPLHSPPINSTPTHNRLASQESYQYPSLMGSPSITATGRPAAGPKSSWDKDSYSVQQGQPERIQPRSQPLSHSGAPSSAPVHVVDARGLMQQLQDKYRAIYPYMPMNDDELELEEDDVVLVMEKCDDGWFVGTSTRTHMFGTFPGNYVEKI